MLPTLGGASPTQLTTNFDLKTTSRHVSTFWGFHSKRLYFVFLDFYDFMYQLLIFGSNLLLILCSIFLFLHFSIIQRLTLFLGKLIFFYPRVVFGFHRVLDTFIARLIRQEFFRCRLLFILQIFLFQFCLLIFLDNLFRNLIFLLFGYGIDHDFKALIFLLFLHLLLFFCNIQLH